MQFRRYQHIEKIGSPATDGLLIGTCYIMPKIDGTNSSTWIDNGEIQAGSRSRCLEDHKINGVDRDNAGFCKWARAQDSIKRFHTDFPNLRLYGEWLVPHSLRTYRDDAWKRFYVFDVIREQGDGTGENDFSYLPYEEYKVLCDRYEIDYIPPIAIIKNPTPESVFRCLDKNGFLVKDGEGDGEGVVGKNYEFVNRYGRVVWGKIVTNEFKEKHTKEMGAPEVIANRLVEEKIGEDYVTTSLVEKEYAKIINETGEWEKRSIPRLLNTVFYSLVSEEMWNIVKAFKNPTIDFRVLQQVVIMRVKAIKPELFGG